MRQFLLRLKGLLGLKVINIRFTENAQCLFVFLHCESTFKYFLVITVFARVFKTKIIYFINLNTHQVNVFCITIATKSHSRELFLNTKYNCSFIFMRNCLHFVEVFQILKIEHYINDFYVRNKLYNQYKWILLFINWS